jgi:MinD-like ATPase involved in chromosome partitioning or flagellar assembly
MFHARSMRVLAVASASPASHAAQLALMEVCLRNLSAERRVLALDQSGDDLTRRFNRPSGFDLATLLWGDREFGDVVTRVNERLALMPAKAGLDEFIRYSRQHSVGTDAFFGGFLRLSQPVDWLVIHARSLALTAELVGAAGEVALVVGDDATQMQEAYLRIKDASAIAPDIQLRLVVCASSEQRARGVAERLAETADRFLNVKVEFGCALPAGWGAQGVSRGMLSEIRSRLRDALMQWQLPEYSLE